MENVNTPNGEKGNDKSIIQNMNRAVAPTVKNIMQSDSAYVTVSNKVTVKRRGNTSSLKIANPQGTFDTGSVVNLGGFIRNKDVGRGLSFEEEELYLPDVIGVQPKSDRWNSFCKEYWANFVLKVPEDGLELEAGFIYKNKQDAEAKVNGRPINLIDYISYRFAKVHPWVAANINDVNKSPKIQFYLYSKTEELKVEQTALDLRKEAFSRYIDILSDRDKVTDTIICLGRKVQGIPYPEDISAVEQDKILEDAAYKTPGVFLEVVKDPIATKVAFIERCISKGFLKRIPNTDIIMMGDTLQIGTNIKEAVAFLSASSNNLHLEQLKGQLKNFK